jgi:hypothetical protein
MNATAQRHCAEVAREGEGRLHGSQPLRAHAMQRLLPAKCLSTQQQSMVRTQCIIFEVITTLPHL